jgi:molybdate transport system substrate-binding protein
MVMFTLAMRALKSATACLLGAGLLMGTAQADTLVVWSSGGYTASLEKLAPEFEKATGHKIEIVLGPSMGTAHEAIPVRLDRGEKADLLIMVGSAIAPLVQKGQVKGETKMDLARSKIAMAVKAGADKPDISTMEAFKAALLKAKSIAYSDSASGVYIEKEMYAKLGLEAELKPKSKMIIAERVGNVVARGDAEVGFQQVSELLPVKGITYVGTIPDAVQKVTDFSAVVTSTTTKQDLLKSFLAFLTTPSSRAVVEATGIEAVVPK